MKTDTIESTEKTAFAINLIVTAWALQNKRVDELLETLSDEQWHQETAPGRNTGVYLLGHLTAVNDGLLKLFGIGDRLYPELETIFLKNPEKANSERPSFSELKSNWKTVNDTLNAYIEKVQPDEWFTRHTSVSAEDFAKEPHRNKLNILINRTNHQSYHVGQLVYLKKK